MEPLVARLDGRPSPHTVGVPLTGGKGRLQLGDAYHVIAISGRPLIAAPGLPSPVPIDAKAQVRVMERVAERFLKIGSFRVNPSWIGWAFFGPDRLILAGAAGRYPGRVPSPDEAEIIINSCGLISVNAEEMVNPELAVFYNPATFTGFSCGQTFTVREAMAADWMEALSGAGWIRLADGRMANPRQAMLIRDNQVIYTPDFSHSMREVDEAARTAIGLGRWCALDIRLSVNLDGLRKISRANSVNPWKRGGSVHLANGCRADARTDKMGRVLGPARRIYPHLRIERYPA